MKHFIGRCIGTVGAKLWIKGGWTGDEKYEDLTVFGKFRYGLFCVGLILMNVTPEDIEKMAESDMNL